MYLCLLLEQTGSLKTIMLYEITAVGSLEWFVITYNKKFREKLGNSSWNIVC
jgi:hypothetical protein